MCMNESVHTHAHSSSIGMGRWALGMCTDSLVNPKSTSNQSSKSCTVLQYPSRKMCMNEWIGENRYGHVYEWYGHVYEWIGEPSGWCIKEVPWSHTKSMVWPVTAAHQRKKKQAYGHIREDVSQIPGWCVKEPQFSHQKTMVLLSLSNTKCIYIYLYGHICQLVHDPRAPEPMHQKKRLGHQSLATVILIGGGKQYLSINQAICLFQFLLAHRFIRIHAQSAHIHMYMYICMYMCTLGMCMNDSVSFSWWVLYLCTGFARLVWGRLFYSLPCSCAPLLWSTVIRTGRTAAATEEGVEIARVQEMSQNGTGVQGRDWLPGNMQQHQPQVMLTSSLEGCSATALSAAIAFFHKHTRTRTHTQTNTHTHTHTQTHTHTNTHIPPLLNDMHQHGRRRCHACDIRILITIS